MKWYLYLFLAVGLAVMVEGCRSQKNLKATVTDLNGTWGVVEMNGKRLDPEQTKQEIVFDVERQTVSGNSGCNRFSGRLEYTPGQSHIIRMLQLASTRMACIDMTLEDEFLKTIDQVVRYEVVNDILPGETIALYGMNNSKLYVLHRK